MVYVYDEQTKQQEAHIRPAMFYAEGFVIL